MAVNDVLAWLWRLGKPLQWRFLWTVHAKFICGVVGVVRDEEGNVLLLRHRLWPPGRQWGFPVKAGRLLKVSSGYKYRNEVYYEATLTGGLDDLRLDPGEILEARLFRPDELPPGMPQVHRDLTQRPGS